MLVFRMPRKKLNSNVVQSDVINTTVTIPVSTVERIKQLRIFSVHNSTFLGGIKLVIEII
jgi:hypothetical protein